MGSHLTKYHRGGDLQKGPKITHEEFSGGTNQVPSFKYHLDDFGEGHTIKQLQRGVERIACSRTSAARTIKGGEMEWLSVLFCQRP